MLTERSNILHCILAITGGQSGSVPHILSCSQDNAIKVWAQEGYLTFVTAKELLYKLVMDAAAATDIRKHKPHRQSQPYKDPVKGVPV